MLGVHWVTGNIIGAIVDPEVSYGSLRFVRGVTGLDRSARPYQVFFECCNECVVGDANKLQRSKD